MAPATASGEAGCMNETATIDPGGPRLERPLQGRVVTGVCAGLARHFAVDVTLVRIVVVVAAFLGGAGVILYVAATLLVPEEGEEQPLIRGGTGGGRTLLLLGAALVTIGAVKVLGDGDLGVGLGGSAIFGAAMIAIGAFLLLRTQQRQPGPPSSTAGEATAGGAPSATADDTPTATATPAPPKHPSAPATLITFGGAIVAAAVTIAAAGLVDDASWQSVAGAAVLAAGLAIAAGSLLGASPLVVAPVLVAAAGALAFQASDVDLSGGVGERTYRPATAADLRDRYRLGVGELGIDLRDTALPRGRTVIRARVGIGDLGVRVPRDATVRVVGHAGAGEVRLLGQSHDGTSVDGRASAAGPRERTVVIEARVGFGAIDVVAADEPFPDDDHDWSRR